MSQHPPLLFLNSLLETLVPWMSTFPPFVAENSNMAISPASAKPKARSPGVYDDLLTILMSGFYRYWACANRRDAMQHDGACTGAGVTRKCHSKCFLWVKDPSPDKHLQGVTRTKPRTSLAPDGISLVFRKY